MTTPAPRLLSGEPVLVVGAGPTGLAAALDLAAFGVPCRIIDRAPHPSDRSRAIGIQARTLELFEQRGMADEVLRQGHAAQTANIYSEGKRLARLDFRGLPTAYPFLFLLDQSVTERIMADKLATLGVAVERGVELLSFRDAGGHVEARLRAGDGSETRMETPFLLGCDGAHSRVREALGLHFVGKTYEQSFLLADLRVDWDRSEDEANVFTSDEGLCAVFPMGKGRHRIIADLSAGEQVGEHPDLAQCRMILERRSHIPARLGDLDWSAYFHVNSRRVEKLRVGRAFVAGDAAHIHSPAGGQGMNTGIQEAINLAWKLALVLRGEAPERLLDTYDAERRPIERQVLLETDVMTNVVGARHGILHFIRDHIAPLVVGSETVQRLMLGLISELSVNYRSGPLAREHRLEGGVGAGERAPDAAVKIADGACARLFELLDPTRFTLLVLGERGEEAARRVAEGCSAPLRIRGISDVAGDDGLAAGYGTTRPALYLVRPDGYVAARGRPADAASLAGYAASWFSARGTPASASP